MTLYDVLATVLGVTYILLGLYRKDPIDVLLGLIAIGVGYPMPRLFPKEAKE